MNPLTAVQFFKQWWFLIAALASMTVAGLTFGIDLSLRVDQLTKKQQVDVRQTANIRANIVNIAEHEIEIEGMQLHMGPGAIQEYGALKLTVANNYRRLERHLDNHAR